MSRRTPLARLLFWCHYRAAYRGLVRDRRSAGYHVSAARDARYRELAREIAARPRRRGTVDWGVFGAGLLIGGVLPAVAVALWASTTPVLTQGSWPLLMGGAVVACALGGAALLLCLHELAGLRDRCPGARTVQREERQP